MSLYTLHVYYLHVTSNNMAKLSDWSVLGLFGKNSMRRFQRYLHQGKRTSGRRSNPVSRQKMCQNGSQESIWESGWEVRDGAGKRVIECEMCTENGGAGKGSGSKGCRGAEHGQECTKECTGAVAVRAALESAVQVGRGDEGNRQAEMANEM
jgi:hypothetical protein